MPRYNVKYNGKWACFSSIPDGFITPLMKKADYEMWRMQEYSPDGYTPAEKCNTMTMANAVFAASLNRSYEETISRLLETGLDRDEVVSLVDVHGLKLNKE